MDNLISKDLLRTIILRDLNDSRRERISLIVSETALIALLTMGTIAFQLFSSEESDEYFMREDGISRLFVSATSLMLLCGMTLLIATLIPYLANRVPKYTLLRRMGISSGDYRRLITIEAGVTYFISTISGISIGLALAAVLRHTIVSNIGPGFKLGSVSVLTYPIVCIVTLGTYALSFLLTRELEADFRVITCTQESARTEKLLERLPAVKILTGCILCVFSCIAFSRIKYHESLYLTAIFYLGLYLACKNVTSIIMVHTRNHRKNKYYRNLMMNNQLYNRFQTTSRYILAFALISFLACFHSGFQIISTINAEPPEELFPYDLMCLADENDAEYIEGLKKNSNIEILEYPMIRVANQDKTEHFERIHEITIQGQQIGISESTYHELKKKIDPSYVPTPLGLDDAGNDIYIVHQQDSSIKAQPLDWYYDKSKPDIHIGVPCIRVLDPFHGTYNEKNIAGEEITSLTGCYSTPKCENIIVFSDNYFNKARNEWMNVDVMTGYSVDAFKEWMGDEAEPLLIQGPTRLVLINADESTAVRLDNEMKTMEEDHKYIGNYDSSVHFHYSSAGGREQITMERAARISINICLIAILLVMETLLLYSKCQMELTEKKRRDRLLKSMGMAYRERRKLLSREIHVFFIVPAVLLIISSAVFLPGTYIARMYSADLASKCTGMYMALITGWIISNALLTLMTTAIIRKEVLNR